MSSKKIDFYFKKKSVNENVGAVNIVNNNNLDAEKSDAVNNIVNSSEAVDGIDLIDVVNTVNTNENAVTSTSSSSNTLLEKPYHPPKNFVFPKTKFGSRYRSCQYKWFNDYTWLHYDLEKDHVFCFYCMKHESKLTAEKNKDPAYITNGFKNWKKAPECFKDHQNSKCHRGATTFEVIVPSCNDPSTMLSEQLLKSRAEERQYLKALMECIQFLARQGLPLRGSDHIDDNLSQLLLLRSKDNPTILKKLSSHTSANNRKFTHQDYQNEILSLMANEVLRTKLKAIKESTYYSIMCDEYTDVANKEQLSFCIRWIDEYLSAKEDFLGYYELPNIKSDTIFTVIKDCLLRFGLSIQNLRGQTYDGASNMMGKRSGVAQKILLIQPKALVTHCHGHSLSLAIKDANKLCSLLNDVMGSIGEIIVLIKFSPKRERMLGTINENIEVSRDDDDALEPATTLAKLSITRWTIRSNAYNKV